jgi:MoxR-like ATPase
MASLAQRLVYVLSRFRNAVVEGPPGTGKTHVVGDIRAQWTAVTGRELRGAGTGRYAITFHPSTAYEDFVEGMRYDEDQQRFVRRDGFLLRIVEDAEQHPEADFLVLLDEINRANVPKVLGDVLLCMEASKRARFTGGAWRDGFAVTLPYSGRQFQMPDNLYLLGTMNSSDRSIAPMDSALRRRFGFLRAEPLSGRELTEAIRAADGPDAAERAARSVEQLDNLNVVLRTALGPDAMLGHSYLFQMTSRYRPPSSLVDDELARAVVDGLATRPVRAFWLEVSGGFGGSKNQFDVPDERPGRLGVMNLFHPMDSPESFTVRWDGRTWEGNSLQYNRGGSNQRLKLKGTTADGDRLSEAGSQGRLEHKIQLWFAADGTFDLELLERDEATAERLRALSTWSERTQPGLGGRWYGLLDLDRLRQLAQPPADDRAEWMTWRFAILPQLVDTMTQLGGDELMDPRHRDVWLSEHGTPDVAERLATFDGFLAELGLALQIQGRALGRSLAIADTGVLPAATGPDNAGDDDG